MSLRDDAVAILDEVARICTDIAAHFLPDACPSACAEHHTYRPPCALAPRRPQ